MRDDMNRKMKWSLGGLIAAILAFFGISSAGAAPSAPKDLTLFVGDSLIVTWTAAPTTGSAVQDYRVTIKTNGQIANTPATVPASVLRFAWNILGVAPGQTVTLEACVEAHNTKWGPAACGTTSYTVGDIAPGAVTIQLQVKPIP
jgi:hypothetical protein